MVDRAPTLLFQGDSITDADRLRGRREANHPAKMGNGYAYLAMCRWLAAHPSRGYQVFNRGISGNRVPDLAARWQTDTVELAPSILSILIGINDLWHKLDGKAAGTPGDYRAEYDALLGDTRRALPEVRLVVCEPFVLETGVVDERWFAEFEQRRAIAEELAVRHGALWVPFHQTFTRAVAAGSDPGYWAADGVHPTPQGHYLMADAWCRVLGV